MLIQKSSKKSGFWRTFIERNRKKNIVIEKLFPKRHLPFKRNFETRWLTAQQTCKMRLFSYFQTLWICSLLCNASRTCNRIRKNSGTLHTNGWFTTLRIVHTASRFGLHLPYISKAAANYTSFLKTLVLASRTTQNFFNSANWITAVQCTLERGGEHLSTKSRFDAQASLKMA